MKLPDYAKAIGISYTTAWRWWKANKLPHPARQTESGLIISCSAFKLCFLCGRDAHPTKTSSNLTMQFKCTTA